MEIFATRARSGRGQRKMNRNLRKWRKNAKRKLKYCHKLQIILALRQEKIYIKKVEGG